jgi:Aspartyl protease
LRIQGKSLDNLQNTLAKESIQDEDLLSLGRRASSKPTTYPGLQGASEILELDITHQKKIEEAIYKQNIEQNLATAYHEHPETFTHVPMLYVACLVNQQPIHAFVDCGAQVTICKIFKLLFFI